MIPSQGGSIPPDRPPDPIPPPLPDQTPLSRVSPRSSGGSKSKEKDLLTLKNSFTSPNQSSRVVHKHSRNDKHRQPLSNLSVNDYVQGAAHIILQEKGTTVNPSSISDLPCNDSSMDVELGDNRASNCPKTSVSFDDVVKSINHNQNVTIPVDSPLKSPCVVNLIGAEVFSPIKNPQFESDMAIESDSGGSEYDDEADSEDGDEPVQSGQGIGEASINNPASKGNSTPPMVQPTLINSTVTLPHNEDNNGTIKDTNNTSGNVWQANSKAGLTIEDRIKRSKQSNKVRIEYFPPTITPEGKSRIVISDEDLLKSAKVYSLHLYGYFLGTSMAFLRVNFCLKRDWKNYGITEITKSPAGYYYFKINSEKGLTDVLEGGPWFVNNIPLFWAVWYRELRGEKWN